ncbi:MAG TPA: response regulator transcription factor [Candidatus Eisenbergiella merdipullorum]|uniref:Stage 0 sporulation protein A homolog n=1 Tax=Candidatus Eisenbergiella merdipullorum TaxID=2838553 RepID=A0A9D2L0A7_9FIRM|nr:response regulator transcription factor [Candidatus Eisenbergiella merdipullorum]
MKLLICDDIKYMCVCFQDAFEELDDFTVVGLAHNREEVLRKVRETSPDVILLDIQMDGATTGIELIPRLKALLPQCKIVILTVHDERNIVFSAIEAGADNYVLKTKDMAEIIQVVRDTCRGKVYYDGAVVRKIVDEISAIGTQQSSLLYMIDLLTSLSRSEREIVKLMYDGKSKREIARIRSVEESTVRSQITNILQKTRKRSMQALLDEIRISGAYICFDR